MDRVLTVVRNRNHNDIVVERNGTMKIKKILIMTISGILPLAMLTACSQKHTHSASEEWDRDAKEHWHTCECGEKLEAAAHSLSDDAVCTVCGSEIWDLGDGYMDVYNYSEYGDLTRMTFYDADGNVMSELRYEYEYDADGSILREKQYNNDILAGDTEYAVNEDGESCVTKNTFYQEDGSWVVNEYDGNGNVIKANSYDADGTVTFEGYYEYAYNADGEPYEAKATETFEDGKYVCEYNEYGDITSRIKYGTDEKKEFEERYEREYDADGMMLWEKTYRDSVLVHEIVSFISGSEEYSSWRCPGTVIDYYEDGTKLVSEYGENTEVATETYYRADGTVDRVLSYQYEYDKDGNPSSVKVYEDDRLASLMEYALDEEGWSYKARMTEYNKDGSRIVCEYDEEEKLVKETKYDADGNEIK